MIWIAQRGKRKARAVSLPTRILSCVLALMMLAPLVTLVRADEPPATYYIYSAEEFEAYSRAYAAGSRNPKDVLKITINSGNTIVTDGFVSLGTSDRPFAGTIEVPIGGFDTFRLYDCPLFNYVTTDMQVIGAGTVKIMRAQASGTHDGALTSGALFANHVVAGTNAASWNVEFLPYDGIDGGTASTSFEGLIGDITGAADVTVNFTNTAAVNVSSAGNVGLICGSLDGSAALTVTTAGSASGLSVTSTGGHAGGLVGEMKNGATLKLASANNTGVTSVTASASGKYAGGVVGTAENITLQHTGGGVDYAVSGRVTGKAGAGGVFGRYITSASPKTFTMQGTFALASGLNVSSSGYTGGVFGLLDNRGASLTFDGNSASETIAVNLSGGSHRGGVCGAYQASALTHTFTLQNTATTVTSTVLSGSNYSAGLIGTLTNSPAYVNIHDVSCTASGGLNGGLIGTTGGGASTGGSFVDATGGIAVSGTADAGLVANMPTGVLRLSGTFDLSGYASYSAASGFLVKNRDRALIYALGDGKGTNGNWAFKRNLNNDIDDVGSWGDVVRCDGTILTEASLFTVDMSAHTVTVTGAAATMNTVTDFAKTALNIQLNTGDGVGALQFTSGNANRSGTLLSRTLTLGGNISLAGTGILGLTRDDGDTGKNAAFSGTFDGAGHTITFATGEPYGLQGNGSALVANSKQGAIHQHTHTGLFANTSGATVQNVTLAGNYYLRPSRAGLRAGGVTATATGGLTLKGASVTLRLTNHIGGNHTEYFGGAVGMAEGSGLAIDVGSTGACTFTPTVTDTSTSSGDSSNLAYFGGAIGYLNATETASPTQSVSFTGSTIGLTYNKTGSADRASLFGSAIAGVANCVYAKDSRQITFNNVTVSITASGKAKDRLFGGILGTDWYAADVTLNGVTVAAGITGTGVADYGGLVHAATGHWDVKDIALSSANYDITSASGSTFGFVTNKAYVNGSSGKSALYLDVDNTGSHYDIGALTFTNAPTFSNFDELVADSRFNGGSIVSNGNAIVSITTSGNTINTNGSYNTYLNKTAYGQSADGKINANTRYYYNLAYAREHTSTKKYDFLTWSVKTYAHDSLAAWFASSSSFSGDLDMTGLSYYPVDLKSGVTFNNATIKLDNVLMDDNVKYAYTGEAGTRSTRSSDNQHYLMHTALFRNDGGATITFSGNNTLQGNVPKLSDSFCGFIIAGTLGGSETSNVHFNGAGLTCDDVHIVTSSGGDLTTNAYAPLLINKVGKNTSLTIDGAGQTSAYSGYAGASKYAASSLIGDVGDDTARAIYLTFTGLKFDGRTAAGNTTDALYAAYGTTKSIFSRATILNSFLYAGESSGTYNYEIDEDWTDGSTAPHAVIYGREVTESVEYAGQEEKYFNSENYYTHPTAYQVTAAAYDRFDDDYLPYVFVGYNAEYKRHELSVNRSIVTNITGCGKYDDPFIIQEGKELANIARIIQGQDVAGFLELPDDLTNYNYTDTGYHKYNYTFTSGSPSTYVTSAVGADPSSFTKDEVRQYLAGAYYKITRDITLEGDNTDENYYEYSLGESSLAQYAFRGQIIGANVTITNKSAKPLIHTSMGAVVKNVTIDVDVDDGSNGANANVIELTAPKGSDTYDYSGGITSYGAVIGQILGGDTILDGVHVTFTDVFFRFDDFVDGSSKNHYGRLTPIGGYVGSLVNGGLIFRNNTAADVGLTNAVCDKINNPGYLYVNPIIGRVLAGYAFYEKTTGAYSVTSAVLNNGSKNYVISDLSLAQGKLIVADKSSQFTITVPDGQAMYVLGAVVNSGAAAGTSKGNMSDPGAYNALSDFWQAYRAHTTVRGGATYAGVGSAPDAAAQNDSYTADGEKIPYIVRAYTAAGANNTPTKNDSCLNLRRISTRTNNKVVLSGACDVPAGFRGIGSIYAEGDTNTNKDYLRLGVYSVSGATGSEDPASYTLTLHMEFRQYEETCVSAYQAAVDSNGEGRTAGFGLFNTLKMNNPTLNKGYIQNLVLSGSIFYDIYTIDGAQSQYLCGEYASSSDEFRKNAVIPTNDVNSEKYLSVGGIAGLVRDSEYFIQDVTFHDFSVEGAKTAGGLVGYVTRAKKTGISYIKYSSGTTNTGYVNVVGGLQAGGLIGRIYREKTEIEGPSDGDIDLIIKNIELKSQNLNNGNNNGIKQYIANQIIGVGGVVGNCWANYKDGKNTNGVEEDFTQGGTSFGTDNENKTQKRLYISYINVVKVEGTDEVDVGNIRVRNDASAIDSVNAAGGFLGVCHSTILRLYHCKLTNVDVKANFAGGLIGYVTQKFLLHFDDVTIDGGSEHSIKGRQFAGGVIGKVDVHDNYHYIDINGVTVKDYTVESLSTVNNKRCAAGGLLGCTLGENVVENAEFRNIILSGDTIKTNYTNGNNECGTGGLVGVSTSNGSKRMNFLGYNIRLDSVTLTHLNGGSSADSTSATNRKIGDIIGNNAGGPTNGSTLKLTGVTTVNMTYCGKHAGYYNDTTENYGSDGYVVFADFGGSNSNHAVAGVRAASDDAYVNITDPAASPYVTVNPVISLSGLTLTGDGVSNAEDTLPIQSILADTTGRYAYAAANYYTGSSGQTNKQAFESYTGKLSTFRTEVTSYLGADFPVLILDDTDSNNSHKMINSYLRLLTNTREDFGVTKASMYEVAIYNVTYSNGFTASLSGPSLKLKGEQFCMDNADYDSGKEQFSLIDVRFKDPGNTGKVAYHLYVPVFVKKVLSYDFDIAQLSGTTYLSSAYASRYGQALIENTGTPTTFYFQYTYSRTAAEWEQAIYDGENVDRNYAKSLLVYKANANNVLSHLPSATILVLVDAATGTPYYATFGDAYNESTNVLDLGAFKATMASDGAGGYTFSGASFTPSDFSSMLSMTVSPPGEGTHMIEDAEHATVTVDGHGYRVAEVGDDPDDLVDITVTASEPEGYFLTVYTESNAVNDELFHYYWVTTPSTFTAADAYPAKINDTGAHTLVHLIMGKIFTHTNLTLLSESSDGLPIMTDANNALTVTFSAEFGINDELGDIKGEMQSQVAATDVYQSFLIYLNRKENSAISKAVLGSPAGSGAYGVDYVDSGIADLPNADYSTVGDIRVTQNYAEFVTDDLSESFANGSNFTIRAAVTLTWDATAVPTQFPGRSDIPPLNENGVTVSGASSIAFQQSATTYSKNSIVEDDSVATSYYSETSPEVASLDLNAIGDQLGDFTPLGINALNNEGATSADLDLFAVLNVSAIAPEIVGYDAARVNIQLTQRQNDGSYGNTLNIATYMDTCTYGDSDTALTDTGHLKEYSADIPRAALGGNNAQIELPAIHCRIKTGSALESAGLTYGNYRITVNVTLYRSGVAIAVSQASNYVVYTNAKIIPEYLV